MTPPATVVARFPAAAGLGWAEVGGGWSGARVWRGDGSEGPRVAVKQLPAGFPADRLRWVHSHMLAARLPVVPVVELTEVGDSVLEHAGGVWECVRWVPGEPVLADIGGPKPTRCDGRALPADAPHDVLKVACATLAALHRAWTPTVPVVARPPAVARRRAVFADADRLPAPPHPLLARAADAVRRAVPTALAALVPWDVPGPVQPCLCDPRPEHFLFTRGTLSGIIDFAAMKPDHPAVDLARLLMETGHLADGVSAYRAAGGHPAVTPALVRVLADTGRVGAVTSWLLRLAGRDPTPAEADRVERLLAGVVH